MLTIRVDLADAGQNPIRSDWRTLDLTKLERGTPREMALVLSPTPAPVEYVGISLVPSPTPEEARHIRELQ
jgi:hypothetical protein